MRLKPVPAAPAAVDSRTLSFDDNRLCAALFGRHHEHLALIEQRVSVSLVARGNIVTLQGAPEAVEAA
ncbi:MAG: PhoH family protein, partial [Geminicoccaceae bacterium]